MRRAALLVLCAVVLACAARPAFAIDAAVTLGSWSFFAEESGERISGEPGLFASVGASFLTRSRFEAGFSFLPRLSGVLLDDIFVEEHLGVSLMGNQYSPSGGPGGFLNAVVDIGLMQGVHGIFSGSLSLSKAAFLRISPMAIGNPFYGRRDRILATGLIYNWDSGALSLFLNIIATDFFLASRREFD